jgi:tellurite resistance protein TerC
MTPALLIAAVCLLVVVSGDIFLTRRLQPRSPVQSVFHGLVFFLAAMGVNALVFLLYDRHIWGLGLRDGLERVSASDASLQFLIVFVLEFTLGLDMVFVTSAVFTRRDVPERLRHAVLMWGMIPAFVVRCLLILGIAALIRTFDWVKFLLAVILFVAAVRMILVRVENIDPKKNILLRLVQRFVPIAPTAPDGAVLTHLGNRPALTPLIVPLLLIETAEAFLAFDSIPASFAYGREPVIILAGSVCALLCVRTMSPAFVRIMPRLRYFKIGLAAILTYSAVIIASGTQFFVRVVRQLPDDLEKQVLEPNTATTLAHLGRIGVAIVFGLLIAWLLGDTRERQDLSALGPDADRLARKALARVRKVAVFIVGVSGLILGAIMAPGPGPGLLVIFFALLILASEFVWARRLVKKYQPMAQKAADRAVTETRRRFRPWMLGVLVLLTVTAGVAAHHFLRIPVGIIIGAVLPMVFGQGLLWYLAFVHKPPQQ